MDSQYSCEPLAWTASTAVLQLKFVFIASYVLLLRFFVASIFCGHQAASVMLYGQRVLYSTLGPLTINNLLVNLTKIK